MSRINDENILAPEIRCDDTNIISIRENNKLIKYIKEPDSRFNNDQMIKYLPLCVLHHHDSNNVYYEINEILDDNDNNKDDNIEKIRENNKIYINRINDITSREFGVYHDCMYIRGYILLNIQAYDYLDIINKKIKKTMSNNILINNINNKCCCKNHDDCNNNNNSGCYCDKIYDKKASKLAIDIGIKYSRSINKYKKIRQLMLNKICKDVVDYILLKYLYDDNIINMIKNDNISDITPYLKSYKKIKDKKLREEMIMNDFSWNIEFSYKEDKENNYILKDLSCLTTETIGFLIELDKKYDQCVIVFNYKKDPYNIFFISIYLELLQNIYPFTSERIHYQLNDNINDNLFGEELNNHFNDELFDEELFDELEDI